MVEEIQKLSIAEVAESLVAYRTKRGEHTTKGDAVAYVKDVFAVLGIVLKEENVGVTLGKVGFIYNGLQKGRLGRHPQTNEPIDIPDKRTLKFKYAPKYKGSLND